MKKTIIIFLVSICVYSCTNDELNFEMKIKRNTELKFTNDLNNNVDQEYEEKEIILKCKEKNCEIFENGNLVKGEKINIENQKKIIENIKKIKEKSKKNYLMTNTETILKMDKEYSFRYIPIEEEEIFDLLSYKNKLLINDEKLNLTKNFSFQIGNQYGNIWRIICKEKNCEVFYYPRRGKPEKFKKWEILITEDRVLKLEKDLVDIMKTKKSVETTGEDCELFFKNGKTYYHCTFSGKLEKLLNSLIQDDYKSIENGFY